MVVTTGSASSSMRMATRDTPDHVLQAFCNAELDSVLFFEQSPIRRPRRPSRYARET
jgi:hypothetical protein